MKNKILYCINMVDIFFLGLFISCMDSANITMPSIGIGICATWLLIYRYSNRIRGTKTPLTDKELEYCAHDVLTLQEVFNEKKGNVQQPEGKEGRD